MLVGFKIRVYPTCEQEKKFKQYSGTSRFLYNLCLAKHISNRENGIKFSKLQNEIVNIQKEIEWLKEIPRKVKAFSVKDCDDSFIKFFKKDSKFPKFKSKKRNKLSFSYEHTSNFGTIPNVGKGKGNSLLKLSKSNGLTRRVSESKISNRLTISYDNKYWYLSGSYEKEIIQEELTGKIIGIDLGLKDLATLNTGTKFENINKSIKVKRLKKKLRRTKRSLSRKYEMNKLGNTYVETKNISKQLIELRLLYRKLTNVRKNYINKITSILVKTKPSKIVMEDLNVSGMMKNKNLSKHIQEAMWYYFKQTLNYKCNKYNIEFLLANRFYPSSKTCSCCGNINTNLKLSDRLYKCNNCRIEIDRDINAAINLSRY